MNVLQIVSSVCRILKQHIIFSPVARLLSIYGQSALAGLAAVQFLRAAAETIYCSMFGLASPPNRTQLSGWCGLQ